MFVKYCVLTLGFLITSSAQDCRINNIHGNILRCYYNGSDVNLKALPSKSVPDGTVCSLISGAGMTDIYCDRSVWNQKGTSELLPHLSRSKRGFFDVLFCVLTFFSCLWGGRGGHSDRTPPDMRCLPPVINVVNDRLQTHAKVSWQTPTAQDNKDGHIKPKRVSGRAPGRHFPGGQHTVTYEAKDRSGNRATCDIIINVTVVTCKTPSKLDNGYFQCFPSADFIYGATCRYGCYEGFGLIGNVQLTCQQTGLWSDAQPRCEPWKCAPLQSLDNSLSTKCSNEYYFRSICSYNCKTGYDMPSGVSKALVCSKTKMWRQRGIPKCIDVEPPVFRTCPGTILRGTDNAINSTVVNWKQPNAMDNSDNAHVLLMHGMHTGSVFTAGIHQISYSAEDAAGNKALHDCSFKVVVRDIRCPRLYPTPYIHFNCPNGYRSGTRCDVSCDPGKTLKGTNVVGCERNPTGLFGEWNWQNGEQSSCTNTRACPTISPPSNGAVVCDNWEGGQYCQVQCRNGTEMSSINLNKLYVCKKSGEWSTSPPNGRKCRSKRNAVLTFEIEASCYFSGDCTDETTRQQIAQNFISTLQNSTLYQPEACPNSDICNTENIQISCGQSSRKKRALGHSGINGTFLQLDIRIPIKIYTIYTDSDRYLAMYANISQILKNNTADIFGNETVTSMEITTSGVQVQCPSGSVKSEQSFSCVDCTEGTFYHIQSGNAYCESCGKGTYQDHAGQNKCIKCPYKTTTRTVGATSLQQCTDACPPGSYSQDGAVPCSPCEQGYYQSSYGQLSCRACNGSKSTLSFGATSISSCEEFDIEFIPRELSEIILTFRENVSMSDFTLSSWFKMNIDNDNNTTGWVTVSLIDESNSTVWEWENLQEISNDNNQVAHTDTEWSDSKWHHILLYRIGCEYSLRIDGITAVVRNMAYREKCSLVTFSKLTITAARDSRDSLSMFNMWHGEMFSDIYRRRCSTSEVGNVVSWKSMEESHLSGAYVHIPSQCDDFDNCASWPCLHGSCQDVLHGYRCMCDQGYFGTDCELNEDDCILSLCLNNATCLDGVSTYTCICPPLVTGKFCEIEQVDGNWNEWGNWSDCSTTCGNGTMYRHRLCNNPTPDNGGKDCIGENNDIQECPYQECPVCPILVAPTHGYLDCQNDNETFNCTILCDDGYDFDIEPLPLYYCGPETSQVWNFETDGNPDRRLPKCVEIHVAKKLSVTYTAYYRDLYCDAVEIRNRAMVQVENTIDTMVKNLPCMKNKTCELENLHVVNCHEAIRERSSVGTAGFNLEISTQPTNDSKDESLSDLEKTFQDIQTAADNGNLTVNVLDVEYVIDGSMTDISGRIDCGFGKTRVNHFCVPCGRGSFLFGDACAPCPVGTYQNIEGQQECINCPTGKSTIGIFSESVKECTVDALSKPEIGLKVMGVIVGSVTGLAVVIFVAFVYRRHRSKISKLDAPTDLNRHAFADNVRPAQPIFWNQVFESDRQ